MARTSGRRSALDRTAVVGQGKSHRDGARDAVECRAAPARRAVDAADAGVVSQRTGRCRRRPVRLAAILRKLLEGGFPTQWAWFRPGYPVPGPPPAAARGAGQDPDLPRATAPPIRTIRASPPPRRVPPRHDLITEMGQS